MKGKQLESEIQKSICDYLALRKVFFWRNNNVPIYDATHKLFRRMPQYTMKGIPDIIAVKQGQFIGLEVKRDKTYQSEHQKAFQGLVERAGGLYYVVRSIEDVQSIGL